MISDLSAKDTQRRLRGSIIAGLPAGGRERFYMFACGADSLKGQAPYGHYGELARMVETGVLTRLLCAVFLLVSNCLQGNLPETVAEQIEKDLPRTFGGHNTFVNTPEALVLLAGVALWRP